MLGGCKYVILGCHWIIEMKPCAIKYMTASPQRSFVLLIFTVNAVVKWPPELLLLEKSNWQVVLASGILDCFSSFLSPASFSSLCVIAPLTYPSTQHEPLISDCYDSWWAREAMKTQGNTRVRWKEYPQGRWESANKTCHISTRHPASC